METDMIYICDKILEASMLWFHPVLDLLMIQLTFLDIFPELVVFFSSFHLEYPSLLSRICSVRN